MKARISFLLFVFLYSVRLYAVTPDFLKSDVGWAEETLAQLTLDQKIGQLFMVAATAHPDPASCKGPYQMDPFYIHFLIEQYHVGGVIFLFRGTPEQQVACTNSFQYASDIPLLIGLDAEWGLSMRLDNVVKFPRNGELGKLVDEKLVYDVAHEIGWQCREIGVHINFAPVVDVNSNPANPVIGNRSFGDVSEEVARKGLLFMRGLQDAGILACAKHFPGHGDTDVDSHLDLPVIAHTRDRLEEVELYPFGKLIDVGVDSVMIAHLSVPALDATGRPASLSSKIIETELKTCCHFEGLVVTDGLGMRGLTNYYEPGDISYQAFLAGNDILLCPVDVPKAHALIKHALLSGVVTEEELDDRVLKILKAKQWAGLHRSCLVQMDSVHEHLHTQEAYALQGRLREHGCYF